MAGLFVILDEIQTQAERFMGKQVRMATSAHIVTQCPQSVSLSCDLNMILRGSVLLFNAYGSLIVPDRSFRRNVP
jgi:hypothetical protein